MNERQSNMEGELLVKIHRKDVNDVKESQKLEERYLRLNEHSIFAAYNKSSGYRGIYQSLEFEQIISKDDYTLTGKCC